MSASAANKSRINPWSIWLIAALMVGGLFIYFKYLQELQRQDDGRPPYYARLETDLEAVEQSGETVSLSQLKGKVYLCNYVFTRCPGQCIGVAEIMREQFDRYQQHPLFHLVSVSLDPAHDTPADLRAFTKKFDLQSDKWWFLTGDELTIRNYMSRYFKFRVRDKPLEERASDRDLFDHEALIALVDHKGHIRGVYSVFDPKQGDALRERLGDDLEKVLEEAMLDTPQESLPEPAGLPVTKRPIAGDIELLRQDGEAVNFAALRGKVSLVSHVFTRCPRQCPGICAVVDEVRKEFGADPKFQVASVTMDPAYDTPEILGQFAETHGFVADNWWFLTGDPQRLPEFMKSQFLFDPTPMAEGERGVANDLYEHDTTVALVDHELNIRGWYNVLDADDMVKLKRHLRLALDDAAKPE